MGGEGGAEGRGQDLGASAGQQQISAAKHESATRLHLAPRSCDLPLKRVHSCTKIKANKTGVPNWRGSPRSYITMLTSGSWACSEPICDRSQRMGAAAVAAAAATMLPRHVKYRELEAVTMVKAAPALQQSETGVIFNRVQTKRRGAPAAVTVDRQSALQQQRLIHELGAKKTRKCQWEPRGESTSARILRAAAAVDAMAWDSLPPEYSPQLRSQAAGEGGGGDMA